jgi:type VI secretion system protein ImpA
VRRSSREELKLDKPKLGAQHACQQSTHMISSEELLKPVAEAQPCGEDLYYDPAFQELESLLRGKPETQFSPAEEPDWKPLLNRCLELSARSKDLRVATTLCVAALKTEGLPALREALGFLAGLIEGHWEQLYPRLDPDDNNDPTQRVNIIGGLSAPLGTDGDPFKMLQRLRATPLTNSARMGRLSLNELILSQPGATVPEGVTAPNSAQVEAAFRDTSPEHLAAVDRAVADSIAALKRIDDFISKTIGADKSPNLAALLSQFKEMQKFLAPHLPAEAAAASADSTAAPPNGAAVARPAASGEIESRDDVIRMLDRLCDYYARREPSSPVPHVLQRAKRLAQMKSFIEIAQDLSPEAVAQLRILFGEKEDAAS